MANKNAEIGLRVRSLQPEELGDTLGCLDCQASIHNPRGIGGMLDAFLPVCQVGQWGNCRDIGCGAF